MYERTKNYWIWKTDWGRIAKIIGIAIVLLACLILFWSWKDGMGSFIRYIVSVLGV